MSISNEKNNTKQTFAKRPNRSKKILVVEDNIINRQILCRILEDEYYPVPAENGKEALKALKEHGEDVVLILLDIIMPEMDGYTFLSIVKSDPLYSDIPVIFATSSDSEEEEIKALSSGGADFIRKPYRPMIVRRRVDNIVTLRETAAMVNLMKYDRLTGIYSREYFNKKAEEAVRRNPEKEYDVICSNIKGFSLINDVLGHDSGDELLRLTAKVVKHAAAVEDGLYGRINADIFAMLLERRKNYNDAYFDPWIRELNDSFPQSRVRLGFGIYQIDRDDFSMDTACDRAMAAIETIHENMTHNHAYYDNSIREQKLREQMIIDSVDSALAERQFVLFYQPKYSLKTEQVVGAEALVRWITPDGKMVMPGQFIPLFERNGFIVRLDHYIWEEACRFIRHCLEQNEPIVPISVNVSRMDLQNPSLEQNILELIEKYDIPPAMLPLEITESAYTNQSEAIINTVSKLSQAGFQIEMDDFGTGYSSLNMLSQLPLDVLKLDIRLVQSSEIYHEKNTLSFIIELAKWRNLTVIAEGAETKEQVQRLKELMCDQVQGFYFSRPLPEESFVRLLRHLQ